MFPNATDEAFADGYAQAVTFGLLMARARNIPLADGLDRVARELRQTNTLTRIMHEEPILGETQEPPCGTNVVFITF